MYLKKLVIKTENNDHRAEINNTKNEIYRYSKFNIMLYQRTFENIKVKKKLKKESPGRFEPKTLHVCIHESRTKLVSHAKLCNMRYKEVFEKTLSYL